MTQTQIAYDKQDQLEKVQAGLLAGEQVIAVYDGAGAGTGFIGVTNLRVLLQDNSFAGKRTALTSLPYSRISSVSMVADKSMLGRFASSSSIAISTGGGAVHEVEFRGAEKARHCHDAILWHMTR